MCSVEPEEVTEMVNSTSMKTLSGICRKCRASGSQVTLRNKDIYCNSCFMAYFLHKFRSTIGKSKQIMPGDRILVAYSSGRNSTILLHLIDQGLKDNSPKKLRFDPTFIFVDELGIDAGSSSIDVCAAITKLGFICYCVRFEEVFNPGEILILKYGYNNEDKKTTDDFHELPYVKKFQAFISGTKSATSYKDLMTHLRNELICHCAKLLGFSKVFLAENGTNLAVRILTDIATGRGSQLTDHVQFRTELLGVEIYRPLRELLEDEIGYCLDIMNVCLPEKSTGTLNEQPDIFTCTENFIIGLQQEQPSTVSTIFKTGSKLVCDTFDDGESAVTNTGGSMSEFCEAASLESTVEKVENWTCLCCTHGLDTHGSGASALRAIDPSRLMSSVAIPQSLDNMKTTPPFLHQNSSSENGLILKQIDSYLCYGCRNIFKDLNCSLDCLQPRILEELLQQRKES